MPTVYKTRLNVPSKMAARKRLADMMLTHSVRIWWICTETPTLKLLGLIQAVSTKVTRFAKVACGRLTVQHSGRLLRTLSLRATEVAAEVNAVAIEATTCCIRNVSFGRNPSKNKDAPRSQS